MASWMSRLALPSPPHLLAVLRDLSRPALPSPPTSWLSSKQTGPPRPSPPHLLAVLWCGNVGPRAVHLLCSSF